MKPIVFVIILFAVTTTVAAQWLKYPTPGIPRTANGKPNLTAPAPRTADGKPDLSGIWQRISAKYSGNVAADLKPGEHGFNDRSWLDGYGHPHSEALRTTERYRRVDFGHMNIEVTLNDPQVYARPWAVSLRAELNADSDLFESVCNESHTSLEHWVGKVSDEKKTEVKVAPEILAKYAGTYEEQDLWGNRPHPAMIEITVSNGALFAELKGREKDRLVAQSETNFSGFHGLGIKFVTDGRGAVTHLLEQHISGDYRFRRTR